MLTLSWLAFKVETAASACSPSLTRCHTTATGLQDVQDVEGPSTEHPVAHLVLENGAERLRVPSESIITT